MRRSPIRIFPLGENALTVEFGTAMSPELNEAAISLARAISSSPFEGFVEAVPAIASTTVFYRSHEVIPYQPGATAFDTVCRIAMTAAAADPEIRSDRSTRTLTVPMDISSASSLDLAAAAEMSALTVDSFIDIFFSRVYRVYMLGFLPGFAYMGTVDPRIAVPRLGKPRTSVPAGSVGIAGQQTGIYPSPSPGGWQIIGRTGLDLLNGESGAPCFFSPGDNVKFVAA